MHTIIQHFNKLLIPFLPETRCFGIKRLLWRLAGVQLGENVRICSSARILGDGAMMISDGTWIGPGCFISSSSEVRIGRDCNIAPNVSLITGTHKIDTEGPSIAGEGYSLPIEIGNGVWICAGCTIIAGVKVGDRSILAAGSVVTQDVPAGELWGGVPARRIKTLIEE